MSTGYQALLIPVVWVLVLSFVAFCAWHDWKGERKPIRRWGALFFLAGAILMSTKIARQLVFQHQLRSLRSNEVEKIRIDGDEVISEDARSKIVSALNKSSLMDPRDGGPVRRSVSCEIELRMGETRKYSFARYHDGASVISGAREAFSSDLVRALDQAGRPLPDWDRR